MRISSIAMMAIALPLAAAAGRTDIGPATNPLVCGETATNAAVCVAAGVDANRFRLSIELDAATNGCVMV